MTKQEQFFYDNAGYTRNPKTQTEQQARAHSARLLARAETWARDEGYRYNWEIESESAESVYGTACPNADCNDPHCMSTHYDPTADFYVCIIEDKDGNAVDSLGMIEAPTREYRRVIEADLAIAIMPEVTK